jgi:hypothetical protein
LSYGRAGFLIVGLSVAGAFGWGRRLFDAWFLGMLVDAVLQHFGSSWQQLAAVGSSWQQLAAM